MTSQQQASGTPADERDEWQTPPYIRRWALELWAPEIDLAATRENRIVPAYLSLAEGRSGLDSAWHRLPLRPRCGWVNPPYSDPKPWICKAIEEALAGFTTVLLLPGLRGDKRDILYAKATELVFIVGRLRFIRPGGEEEGPSNLSGSMIAVYRGRDLGNPRVRWAQRDALRARWWVGGDPGKAPAGARKEEHA